MVIAAAAVRVGVAEGGIGVAEAVAVPVAEGVAEAVGVSVGVRVALEEGVPDAVGAADAVGLAVGDGGAGECAGSRGSVAVGVPPRTTDSAPPPQPQAPRAAARLIPMGRNERTKARHQRRQRNRNRRLESMDAHPYTGRATHCQAAASSAGPSGPQPPSPVAIAARSGALIPGIAAGKKAQAQSTMAIQGKPRTRARLDPATVLPAGAARRSETPGAPLLARPAARRGGKRRQWPAIPLLLILAAAAMPVDSTAAHGLQRVRERGVLRWGGDLQGGEPYVFRDPRDASRIIGFEVDIAEAVARRMGVRAEFVQNDWHHLIPALERGDFDVILNGLEVTPARRERIAFTRPYYAFTEVLVVRAGDGHVSALPELRGWRIGTLQGSLAFDLLQQSSATIVLYEGVEEPYRDLEQGRLDGVLLDNIIADRYGLPRPGLRIAATLGTGQYAAGVRPDEPELLSAVDSALGAMAAEGELRAILEKWRLWNELQERLGTSRPEPVLEPPMRWMTWDHLWLFLRATGVTLAISTCAMALAVVGGLGVGLCRRYGSRAARALATAYIEIFRGTPLLLQLYVLYYGLAPVLPLGAFTAAVLGLGMNYAAYEAELYRAGLEAVPREQAEAAMALGMSHALALRRILLPQALRVALPGIANDFIAVLKDSSLVSVITVVELTKQMTITAVDLRGWLLPGLLCAGLYLGLSYPLSRLARRLERRLTPTQR